MTEAMFQQPLSEAQLVAILHLLEHEDDHTAGLIQEQLLLRPHADIRRLEKAMDGAGPRARRRLSRTLDEGRDRLSLALFEQLTPTEDGDFDLEEGSFLLARCAYPDVAMLAYRQQLDRLALALEQRLPASRDPEEVLAAISAFIYKEQGFRGNTEDYYHPDNSYMNRVLERRLGIPITLAALLLFLGQRLGLPLVGARVPGHFILKYLAPERELLVDPFNEARILSRMELKTFLRSAGFGYAEQYLEPAGNRYILARMARNLAVTYERRGDSRMHRRIEDFLAVLHQRR